MSTFFINPKRVLLLYLIMGIISSSIFITTFLIAQLMNIIPKGPWPLSIGILLLSIPTGLVSQELKHVITCSFAVIIASVILTISLALTPVFIGYLGEAASLYVVSVIKWTLGNIYLLIPMTIGGSIIGYLLREIFLS